METLVYSSGGDFYHGVQDLTDGELKELKQTRKQNGSVGYMIGHRYWNNKKERVIVFFSEKPADITAEELRRRENGFLGAKYRSLKKY